jgi:hypothetical protein
VIDPNEEYDEQHLTLRTGGKDGTTALALVHLVVVDSTQIVTAVLRPDTQQTRIAAQWAESLGLSPGAGMIARLAVDEQELWGPDALITPIVEDSLDDEIDDEGVGGLVLANDFLHTVWVTFMGEHKLVVISYQPSEA